MSSSNWIALAVGVLTALVAAVGYLLNQAANRREHRARIYADALEAVREYEELPIRIARRGIGDAATRTELGGRISDSIVRLGFYRAWLLIESIEVGSAYGTLLDQSHRIGRRYRAEAWTRAPLTTDKEAHLVGLYSFDNKPEWNLCMLVMRRELSVKGRCLRSDTLRRVANRRVARDLPDSIWSATGEAAPK